MVGNIRKISGVEVEDAAGMMEVEDAAEMVEVEDGNLPDLEGTLSDDGGANCEEPEMKNRRALLEMDLQECIRSLLMSQMCEPSSVKQVQQDASYASSSSGLMWLLQKCLEDDHNLHQPDAVALQQQKRSRSRGSSASSAVVLSGYIEHFESKLTEDLGWGCGWRNIQMMCSYLLARQDHADMREIMFGGAGFVPNISALQRWLEVAWAKGFDVSGAEYFDWKIAGTQKWIGTTECAALLRSFGVRARIIDFRAVGSKQRKDGLRTKCGSRDSLQPINLYKISLDQMQGGHEHEHEHQNQNQEDVGKFHVQAPTCHVPCEKHDKCELCMSFVEERKLTSVAEQQEDQVASSEVITSDQRDWDCSTGGGNSKFDHGTESEVNHEHMTDWIWNYFLSETKTDPRMKTSCITLSNFSPLYFQHRGHSRTIVGIERCIKRSSSRGSNLSPEVAEDQLIMLDPSLKTSDIITSLRRKQGWQELVKRGLHTLKEAEYQLCFIEPGIATGDELESLKVLSSIRYKY